MSVFTIKERRLTFQRVRTSALHCCVPQCTNSSRYNKLLSFHSFPVDPAVRAEWLRRIRRDNFSPTKHTRVCGRHFKITDLVVTAGGLRKLQKGSVPVLFSWNGFELPAPRPSVWERRPRPDVESPDVESPDVSDNEMEIAAVATDHDYSVLPQTGIRASELAEDNEALRRRILELEQQIKGLHLRQRFGLHRLTASDDSIRFYTRFASYQHFQAFWSLVEPAVNSKMVRITSSKTASNSSSSSHQTKLPAVDELLLFLMYLSVGLPLNDLAERFNIHRSTASRIVSTWTQFLYTLLGSKRLWLPSEVVRAHLPPEFAAFADTQAVFDCTEIFCQTPSSLLLQSEVFSTYKSHPTLKAMIGMAPHGAITFVSGLYAGSISDREIFKLSGITKLLKPDMAIMVDKGFRVDDLVPCKVYRPAFLSKNTQMSRENVRQTQSIARLRVHVERCIRRVKENKLFDTEIPLSVCGNIDQLFSVACFLVNYQNGPLVKAWAIQQ